ncbi:hypothetical protein DFR86_11610 [Acidianus sulfidivorans JP7]|uniref:Type III-B CRISPR module-associated protein Cmr3 n=1 Tax=Acidianus sulfidivorans JP7 TaxID=619593 RepID=A0A2U9IQ60_9CREN|nr:hypothetical protein [Acidianus sulfidivorans]AWR98117.1 hypothetical protein DFR86_11610 [Acidianus sulfidivorans JP7]
MVYVLIKPLNPVMFRWGGEYSPLLTGPMNKGMSEPLPLPSTIAGFLYWINKHYSTSTLVNLDIEEDYKTISSVVEIWGPLFYVKGKDKEYFLTHKYPRELYILGLKDESNSAKSKIEPVYISKIGIGMRMEKKTAHTDKGLIYTAEFVDYYATAKKLVNKKLVNEVEEYGILVETNINVNPGYYPFGGEGRIVEVKVLDNVNLPKESKSIVLSPIIMKGDKKDLILADDVKELDVEDNVKLGNIVDGPVRLALIGLGFNVKAKVKRPIYLAIMPGSIIKSDKKHLGLFNKVWGSVL